MGLRPSNSLLRMSSLAIKRTTTAMEDMLPMPLTTELLKDSSEKRISHGQAKTQPALKSRLKKDKMETKLFLPDTVQSKESTQSNNKSSKKDQSLLLLPPIPTSSLTMKEPTTQLKELSNSTAKT